MNALKNWILPKEIDFFRLMSDQSTETLAIIEALGKFYTENPSQNPDYIFKLIAKTKKNRSLHLKNLNATFITPVDKEAIGRVISQTYWVALSVKHLIVEIDTYKIYQLSEYKNLFVLLRREMAHLTDGLNRLRDKDYDGALKTVDRIIHLDNELIKKYAGYLAQLFNELDFKRLLMHREILAQLKEISRRIHVCANQLEDIVFKMN